MSYSKLTSATLFSLTRHSFITYHSADCQKGAQAIIVDSSANHYQCAKNTTGTNSLALSSEGSCGSGDVYLSFCSSSAGSTCKDVITSRPASGSTLCVTSPVKNAQYVKHFCLGGLYTNIKPGYVTGSG